MTSLGGDVDSWERRTSRRFVSNEWRAKREVGKGRQDAEDGKETEEDKRDDWIGRAADVWARGLKERLEDGRTGTVDL